MNTKLLGYLGGLGGGAVRRAKSAGLELDLHALSAASLLEARKEASELCRDDDALPLWQNACIIARSARIGRQPAFSGGGEVMQALSAEQIGAFMKEYLALCEEENPSACMDGEKIRRIKDELGASAYERLKWRVLKDFGALVTEKRVRDMTDGDYLYCILNQWLDDEEELDRLCPSCRREAEQERCPACGSAFTPLGKGENPDFDMERYNILAKGGVADG